MKVLRVVVFIYLTTVLAFVVCGLSGASDKYEVKSLPGWEGKLPSPWYSGYTYAGTPPNGKGSMYMHWVLVESENDPKNDPLIIWYNGGPGASSIFGLLVELGPLLLTDLSLQNITKGESPKLIRNPYSWVTFANLLIVENPPPIGFSFCNPAGVGGDGYSCGNWNDSAVGIANHEFLKNWFNEFSEYKTHDLYITGESYAGVYVPVIVRQIMNDPAFSNLKGFAVGDGCVGSHVYCSILTKAGNYTGPYWFIEFMHGHGQVSNSLYREIMAKCTMTELRHGKMSTTCNNLVTELNKQVGGYFSYALYDECSGNIFNSDQDEHFDADELSESVIAKRYEYPYPPFPGPGYPCSGPAMSEWLKRDDVRDALNVHPGSFFFNSDDGEGFNYDMTEEDLRPFYAHVVRNTNLRVLVYNGDTDPSINSMVTQDIYFEYFDQVGIKMEAPWRAWTLNGKQWMGGYVTEFEGDFAFLTVRGSGHMVPEFKPVSAHSFMKTFIHNRQYQPYTPSSNGTPRRARSFKSE